jgi:hypothetical protein
MYEQNTAQTYIKRSQSEFQSISSGCGRADRYLMKISFMSWTWIGADITSFASILGAKKIFFAIDFISVHRDGIIVTAAAPICSTGHSFEVRRPRTLTKEHPSTPDAKRPRKNKLVPSKS